MAQTKQSSTQFGINDLVGSSNQYTQAALRAAVESQKATDHLVQNWIDAGFSFQEASLRSTRDWINTLASARQGYLKQGTEVMEKALTLSLVSIEYPFKKEFENFNANVVEGMKRTFESLAGPFAKKQ